MTALNFDKYFYLEKAIEGKAIQHRTSLAEQPSDKSSDQINKEVRHQIDDWSNRVEEAHLRLGGNKKAGQFLAKIERHLFVEQHYNLSPNSEAKKEFLGISSLSGKLASLLDSLHSDNQFRFESELSNFYRTHRAPLTLQVSEIVDALKIFQNAAERALAEGRRGQVPTIEQVDFIDDQIRSELPIGEETKTLAFSPRGAFVWRLINEYQTVFGRKPAWKRTSKFVKAIEVLVELAGFKPSGLEPVVRKMNEHLPQPNPTNPWYFPPPTLNR